MATLLLFPVEPGQLAPSGGLYLHRGPAGVGKRVADLLERLIMKFFTVILFSSLLCGCDKTPLAGSHVVRVEARGESDCHVQIITLDGHWLAVCQNGQNVAICEVTDASLVKTNAEK